MARALADGLPGIVGLFFDGISDRVAGVFQAAGEGAGCRKGESGGSGQQNGRALIGLCFLR